MSQKDRIKKYIFDFGSITNRDAVIDLAIGRLSARIEELRREGVPIVSVMEKGKNRYGETTVYARYSISA